jgi:hypothetical protein
MSLSQDNYGWLMQKLAWFLHTLYTRSTLNCGCALMQRFPTAGMPEPELDSSTNKKL